MRKELDRGDAEHFDLKQGRGGIGDIEFLVQYLVLRKAGEHDALIEYTDNIRQLDALVACGEIAQRDATDLQEIYRQYRHCQHHLVLNDEPAMDVALAREDVLDAGRRLLEHDSRVGAVVLECTNMTPYAADLRAELGLPVFGIYSFVQWFQAGLLPRVFAGTIGDPRPARPNAGAPA